MLQTEKTLDLGSGVVGEFGGGAAQGSPRVNSGVSCSLSVGIKWQESDCFNDGIRPNHPRI